MTFQPLISGFWLHAPLILIWLVGIIVAIVTWRKHPPVSILTILALLLFLFNVVAGETFIQQVIFQFHARGLPARMVTTLLTLTAVLRTVISITAWVMILAAVFIRRGRPAA
jgi:hypothetical protein